MNAYFTVDGNPSEGNYFIIIGIIGIAVSAYMLLRTKRGLPKKIQVPQRVSTTIQCEKCGFKKIRNFERGDYIYKEAETCPKCNEKMMIASIYRELRKENKVQ